MKPHFTHNSRPWGIAVLSVVGLAGYGAATNWPEEPSNRGPVPAELAPAYLDYVVTPQRTVLHESDQLAIPYTMAAVGSRLVVIDVAADQALHVIDRTTGKLIRSFGNRGGGPGEFQDAWSIDPIAGSSSEIWIYDAGLRRMNYVDLRDEFFTEGRLGKRNINLISNGEVTGLVHTNDNRFVGPGFFTDGRLGVFDQSGKLVDQRGPIPQARRELPPLLRQYMYQSTVAAHPSHNRIALASRFATALEIFGSDGSLITLADSPLEIVPDPETTNAQGVFVQKDETPLGYTGVAASRDYIFALFSGRTAAEARDREMFGAQVHVFDWDGTLHAIVELEVVAVSIAVDNDASRLYAVEHDPVPVIVEYDLSEIDLGTPR